MGRASSPGDRLVVAGLRGLARGAVGGAEARADRAGRPAVPGAGGCARQLRARHLLDGLARELAGYHLLHASRGSMLERLGRRDEAAEAYGRAAAVARADVDTAFLARRHTELATDQPQ